MNDFLRLDGSFGRLIAMAERLQSVGNSLRLRSDLGNGLHLYGSGVVGWNGGRSVH